MTDASAQRSDAAARDQAPWISVAYALLFGAVLAAAAFIAYRGRAEYGDEGSFCTIAQGLLGGRLPYRDLFNEKPPLQYVWTAAVMALGGPTLAGARLASGIALALSAGVIALGPLRRRANGLVVAGVMLATAVVAVRLEAYRNTADSTLAVFYALSAVLLARQVVTPRNALTLGLLHGLALGFRQTAAASALVILLAPRLTRVRAAFGFGLVAGLLVWLVPLAASGVLPDFVQATLLFHIGNSGAASYLHHGITDGAGILTWGLLLACVGASSSRGRSERIWVLCWLVAAALAYFGRKEEFRLWPSAAAALAWLAWRADLSFAPASAPRARVVAGLMAVAALVAGATAFLHPPARLGPVGAVADAVARVARPQDEVWAGPFSPYVYCLSQRRPASRYYFVLPWTDKAEVRREIVRDILAKRPLLVIQRSVTAFDIDKLLPELDPILKAHYRPEPSADAPGSRGFTIYRPIVPEPPVIRAALSGPP